MAVDPSLQRLRRGAATALAGGGLLLAALSVALSLHRPGAALAYAVAGLLVWRGLPAHAGDDGRPLPGFGAANGVTLARAVLVIALAAMLLPAGSAGPAFPGAAAAAGLGVPVEDAAAAMRRVVLVALAAFAAALDAVDGALARARGLASAFGARFDMETDAFLVLVLSLHAWQAGVAGAWVLASGLMRYAFVAAAAVLPWLGRPLPPSRRRQAVCVVQIVCLLAGLLPGLPAAVATALAVAGLAALAASFAADVRWLGLRRRPAHGA